MKHVKAQKNQRKKAVKKQVAKLAMKKKEPKADTATLNRHLLRLMDKPWKSCSPEEQRKILESLPVPNHTVYKNFHTSMRTDKEIPEHFAEEYKRIMHIKGIRGCAVGKTHALQKLCKQWWLAVRDEEGNLQKRVMIYNTSLP